MRLSAAPVSATRPGGRFPKVHTAHMTPENRPRIDSGIQRNRSFLMDDSIYAVRFAIAVDQNDVDPKTSRGAISEPINDRPA